MKGKKKDMQTPKEKGHQGPLQPRTPYHGKSLASYTQHTVALFKSQLPSTSHQKLMVEKLAQAANKATAENVILGSEIEQLQQQTIQIAGIMKTKSQKVLSSALLVLAADVVRLREESDRKEEKQKGKRLQASLRKGTSEKKSSLNTEKKKLTLADDLQESLGEKATTKIVEVLSASDGEEWEEDGGETMSQEVLGTQNRQPRRISCQTTRNNPSPIILLKKNLEN